MNTFSEFEESRNQRLLTSKAYYRYQPKDTTDDSRLKNLSSEKIWFSAANSFNDPMDIRLKIKNHTYRGPFPNEDSLRAAMKCLLQLNPNARDHWFYDDELFNKIKKWSETECLTLRNIGLTSSILRRFNQFGIACFSPIWDNQLMWAHYASSHQGFCIEYSVKPMKTALENQGDFSQFHVQYSSELPELCVSEALFCPHTTLERLLATKHTDWAYENEWRLVHYSKQNQYIDIPAGMEISALIAGLKTDPSYWKQIKEKADLFKIPAFRIKKRDYSYELEMVPIT